MTRCVAAARSHARRSMFKQQAGLIIWHLARLAVVAANPTFFASHMHASVLTCCVALLSHACCWLLLQIHGIWFFEEADLNRVSALLNKILAQLPKPDAGVTYIQHAEPAAAVEAPPAPAAPAHATHPAQSAGSGASGGGGGDGFWDRPVHVTESTLQQNQQLVPNNNLLDAATAPVSFELGY